MCDWNVIDEDTEHGEYILYFPEEPSKYGRRTVLGETIKVDRHPVPYPRKPTHYIPLPKPPIP